MDSQDRKRASEWGRLTHGLRMGFWGLAVLVSMSAAGAETGPLFAQMQISPLRQDSINKMPSAPDNIPSPSIAAAETAPSGAVVQEPVPLPSVGGVTEAGYDPSGRRDPFAPIIQASQQGKIDENLPPLQRVAMVDLNLIAVVWGTYGYVAMVQTPDGHGYTVRRGTKVGQNNGIVSAVTERGIIVQERFTDVYGKKQEREFVKLLHPKEGSE